MMYKKILIIILCIILITNLTGCYDLNEVDDLIFIIAIGIDKGTNGNITVSIQYSPLVASSSDSGGLSDKDELSIASVETSSIFNAIDLLNTNITRRFSLTHLKFLVFSEEIAREGINSHVNSLIIFRELRYSTPILISKTSAKDFLNENKSVIGPNPAKTVSFIPERSLDTGLYPQMLFEQFNSQLLSTYIQPVGVIVSTTDVESNNISNNEILNYSAANVPIKSKVNRRVLGTAVFNKDKMLGELNGDETRIFLMALGYFKNAFMDIRDPLEPDKYISLDVRLQRKPKIKSRIIDNKVYIDLKIFLEPNINSIQSNINYLDIDMLPILEEAFEDYVKKTLDEIIDRCQNEYNSDIFGFGKSVVKHFLTINEWENFNYLENFNKAIITTDVNVAIRRTGVVQKIKEND